MNILVVDDSSTMRTIVSNIIAESGHTPITADGHVQALLALKSKQIELILMDIEMPEMNGFQLTQKIRELYTLWIPIIFLSTNDSEDYLSRGIDSGGDDYLTKPVNQIILSAKIRAMERIAHMQGELDRVNKQLEVLTSLDPLTQVLNRRGLEETLAKSWQTNVRQQGEMSLLMIDIDYFKPYNDHYGHLQGDDCLVLVAKTLSDTINRTTDFVARYGGEEFVIILPFTPLDGARFKAKEILKALSEQKIVHEYSTVSPYVTVSIGVASTCHLAAQPTELIEQADHALYQAKENGRNCSSVYVNC